MTGRFDQDLMRNNKTGHLLSNNHDNKVLSFVAVQTSTVVSKSKNGSSVISAAKLLKDAKSWIVVQTNMGNNCLWYFNVP